jgi:hypothetical protein
VTPRGGLLLCEDAAGNNFTEGERLVGLTLDWKTFTFAMNNMALFSFQEPEGESNNYVQGRPQRHDACQRRANNAWVMFRVISLTFILALVTATAASAQTTPWGDPDLQGVWSNQTPVPLERPVALADKRFFTREEAANLDKNALATTLKGVADDIPTSGEFNRTHHRHGAARGHLGRPRAAGALHHDGQHPRAQRLLQQLPPNRAGARPRGDCQRKHAPSARRPAGAPCYRLTVSDPGTFRQPWTLQNILWRTDEPVFEAACHEGNVGLSSILSGARATQNR